MLLTACNQINVPAFMSDYDARLRAALTVPDDLALGVDIGTTSLSVQLLSLHDCLLYTSARVLNSGSVH